MWLHASGCPGSHVVIRTNGSTMPETDVVQDAAALAARQSKCTGNVIKVRLYPCINSCFLLVSSCILFRIFS